MKALEFGPTPIPWQVDRGQRLTILRSPAEDQQGLGQWFDGRGKRTVEDVTWLNPSLISRWYGTLSHREGWSPDELRYRWEFQRHSMEGKVAFLIRLAALPKQPSIFDDDEPAKTDPSDLYDLRGFIRYKVRGVEKTAELKLQQLDERQSTDRDNILDVDWFTFEPNLGPTVYKFPEGPGYPLGENYGISYFASMDIPADLGKANSFSGTKWRRVTFWLSRG